MFKTDKNNINILKKRNRDNAILYSSEVPIKQIFYASNILNILMICKFQTEIIAKKLKDYIQRKYIKLLLQLYEKLSKTEKPDQNYKLIWKAGIPYKYLLKIKQQSLNKYQNTLEKLNSVKRIIPKSYYNALNHLYTCNKAQFEVLRINTITYKPRRK